MATVDAQISKPSSSAEEEITSNSQTKDAPQDSVQPTRLKQSSDDIAPNKSKVGKALLDALRNKTKDVINTPVEILPITDEILAACRETFIQSLSVDGKDLVRTQLMAANCTVVAADTINCECFNQLQQNTINSIKNEFANYFIKQTNNPRIKVLTSLSEAPESDDNRVLTKNEVFEALAQQYPQLYQLRETLGLSVMASYPYEPAEEIKETVMPNSNQPSAALDDTTELEDENADD